MCWRIMCIFICIFLTHFKRYSVSFKYLRLKPIAIEWGKNSVKTKKAWCILFGFEGPTTEQDLWGLYSMHLPLSGAWHYPISAHPGRVPAARVPCPSLPHLSAICKASCGKVRFQILLEGLFKNTSPASSASFSGYPPLPGPSGCVLHPVQLWRFQIFTPLIFLVIFQLLRLFLFYFLIVHIHLLCLAGGFLSLKK